MRQRLVGVLIVLLILLAMLPISSAQQAEDDLPSMLFDDFNYTAHDDLTLTENGWTIRDGEGWPGVEEAQWWAGLFHQ